MKAFFRKKRVRVLIIILAVIVIVLVTWFFIVRSEALKRFAAYEAMAESVDTSYGKVSYIDKGSGEPFRAVHLSRCSARCLSVRCCDQGRERLYIPDCKPGEGLVR